LRASSETAIGLKRMNSGPMGCGGSGVGGYCKRGRLLLAMTRREASLNGGTKGGGGGEMSGNFFA